ncbi:hypothetical protein M0813_25160 [Anaeramoeba flamelloides]|uniref:GOLD domain-containing protein n=1 Tax=Anaeramoeba flamelloides TaxID=1746091 RepID=A0AAV7ZUT8_9EUKA|nr:hypothetical protein M0812_10438 [Anaeramoeba flamelloides]KAJ6239278.1 hypothetical protein M0813_25160 [Anaeramoeba flamelloides]
MKFLFSLFLSIFIIQTQSITITVNPNSKECLIESVDKHTGVTLFYQVISGGGMDINPEILGPDGVVVYKREKEQEGKFTFLTRTAGEYRFCFGNEMSTVTTKQVNFNFQIGHGSDSGIAKKEHLTPLENGVLELQEQLRGILSEQRYLKAREHIHRNTTESTNSRVLWWSFLQTLLLIAMGVAQIFYIKRIFEKTKKF